MNQKILLYSKSKEIDNFIDFLDTVFNINVIKIKEHFLQFDIDDTQISISTIREISVTELYQDFTAYVNPDDFILEQEIVFDVLPKLNYGIYDLQKFLKEMIFSIPNYDYLPIKNALISKFGQETMDTVLGFIAYDLNASKASKGLFMHRNTLNYRLDHFKGKSGIDIRTFEGAFILYFLFQ